MNKGVLYLIPSPLGEGPVEAVLPAGVLAVLPSQVRPQFVDLNQKALTSNL